jgi:hypothetical protein
MGVPEGTGALEEVPIVPSAGEATAAGENAGDVAGVPAVAAWEEVDGVGEGTAVVVMVASAGDATAAAGENAGEMAGVPAGAVLEEMEGEGDGEGIVVVVVAGLVAGVPAVGGAADPNGLGDGCATAPPTSSTSSARDVNRAGMDMTVGGISYGGCGVKLVESRTSRAGGVLRIGGSLGCGWRLESSDLGKSQSLVCCERKASFPFFEIWVQQPHGYQGMAVGTPTASIPRVLVLAFVS